MKKYILSLDQGTTSSRTVVFDHEGRIKAMAQYEFGQIYPRPGWVEHDPMEILFSQTLSMAEAIKSGGVRPEEIAAIGITNQRETIVAWDRATGKPVMNAIVWQCRRTAPFCEELKAKGMEPLITEATGLIADPYFSGTKIRWILDHAEMCIRDRPKASFRKSGLGFFLPPVEQMNFAVCLAKGSMLFFPAVPQKMKPS